MTQVTDHDSVASRVFELLLALSGRVDDDALTDVRELLARAEPDRALALLVGCLDAEAVVVSPDECDRLEQLCQAVLLGAGTTERLRVNHQPQLARPRFAAGTAGAVGTDPRRGVLPAIEPALEVLHGVRDVHCVWRATTAGPTPSAVPRLVVLVRTDAVRHPAAIAYRLERALRGHGDTELARGVVEVLPDGMPVADYHRKALAEARELELPGFGATAAPGNTAEPVTTATSQHSDAWHVSSEPQRPVDMPEPASPHPSPRRSGGHARPSEPEPEPLDVGSVFFGEPEPSELAAPGDEVLNDTERDLLRQLHEELGKREREQAADTGMNGTEPMAETGIPGASGISEASDDDWQRRLGYFADTQTSYWPTTGGAGEDTVNGWPPRRES